ncbi:MAG: hypothetical protein LBI81_01180 [Puniceicoccales bacterium]|nr:hypothetical protein [Puniceicoccales bacterium]
MDSKFREKKNNDDGNHVRYSAIDVDNIHDDDDTDDDGISSKKLDDESLLDLMLEMNQSQVMPISQRLEAAEKKGKVPKMATLLENIFSNKKYARLDVKTGDGKDTNLASLTSQREAVKFLKGLPLAKCTRIFTYLEKNSIYSNPLYLICSVNNDAIISEVARMLSAFDNPSKKKCLDILRRIENSRRSMRAETPTKAQLGLIRDALRINH